METPYLYHLTPNGPDVKLIRLSYKVSELYENKDIVMTQSLKLSTFIHRINMAYRFNFQKVYFKNGLASAIMPEISTLATLIGESDTQAYFCWHFQPPFTQNSRKSWHIED